MTPKERAFALGNDLANAHHPLAKNRQFDDDDLPIFIKHIEDAEREIRNLWEQTAIRHYAEGFRAAMAICRAFLKL